MGLNLQFPCQALRLNCLCFQVLSNSLVLQEPVLYGATVFSFLCRENGIIFSVVNSKVDYSCRLGQSKCTGWKHLKIRPVEAKGKNFGKYHIEISEQGICFKLIFWGFLLLLLGWFFFIS